MAISFNDYPYTNFHELNADWILSIIKSLETEITNFVNLNTIKYANPIDWNITTQYEANTVVIDPATGNAYISVQAVPNGVNIGNTNYWTPIFNYQNITDKIEKSIASLENTGYASTSYTIGQLLWMNDNLYIVTIPISKGSKIIIDTNVKALTIEYWVNTLINALRDELLDEITAREDLENEVTLLRNDLGAEINNREAADLELQKSLAYVTPEMYGAVGDGVTDDTESLKKAVATNKAILFTSGKTYLISEPISLRDNIIINGNMATLKLSSNLKVKCMLDLSNLSNIEISNVIFDCNGFNQPTMTLDESNNFYDTAIYLDTTTNVNIHDCIFTNLYGVYIRVYKSNGYINICNNQFTFTQPDIQWAGMCIHCTSNDEQANIFINNNDFIGEITSFAYGINGIFLSSQVCNVTVSNNTFYNCGRISSTSPVAAVDLYIDNENVAIIKNKFISCAMLTRCTSSNNVTISDNIFDEISAKNPPTNIISIGISSYYGTKHETYNINVRGNKIIQYSAAVSTIGIGSNYTDIAPHDVVIESNQITTISSNTVEIVSNSYNISVINNKVVNTNGVFVRETMNDNTNIGGGLVITNNDVNCNTFFFSTSTSDVDVKQNIISNNIGKCLAFINSVMPFICAENIILTNSPGTSYTVVQFNKMSTKSHISMCHDNMITGYFTAPAGDSLYSHDNYINGVNVNETS